MKSLSDYTKDLSASIEPRTELKINSKEWKPELFNVTRVEVSSSICGEASTCFVEMTSMDIELKRSKIKLNADFSDVKIGAKFEALLGYKVEDEIKCESVFKGYISAMDVEIKNNRTFKVSIQGMDAKMWMMSNRKTELKKGQNKYSMVVRDVCNDYLSKLSGRTIEIKNEVKFEKNIYQRNESDFEFLSRIARLTGCLFFINLGKLNFISPTVNKSPKLKITPEDFVFNAKVSASVWGIPKSVEVVGTDPKDYEQVISAKASNSDGIGDGKDAASLTSNISDVNTIKIVDNTITSVNEANFLAEGIYNLRELNLMEAVLEVIGYPLVELGMGVKLDDFGAPIDNDYIVSGIKHYCICENETLPVYKTRIFLKTNRMNPREKINLF